MGRAQRTNDAWWVSTKDFLPNNEEKVLIISKWGHVSNAMYTDYGLGGPVLFRPDGLKPDIDVKWWMPIPADGWHRLVDVPPQEGQVALTMGYYGNIYSGIWKRTAGSTKFDFHPVIGEVLFWREMPVLPAGVTLKF